MAMASLRAEPLNFAAPQAFSWNALVQEAKDLAHSPYRSPYMPAPELTEQIDYSRHGQIHFRTEQSLYSEGPNVYPMVFFPLGKLFKKSVRMHVLENGMARELNYSKDYFDMPADNPARDLPADAGFAGFQIKEAKTRKDWRTQDWVAFLGASYFRTIGEQNQYGLSARGIAVDVAAPTPEEFPDFTDFYIEGADQPDKPITVYARLNGPSIAGAFRFKIYRTQGVIMDVESALFMRKDVYRLGVAPLTSMFWYNAYNRPQFIDWRPEIHDSDGLEIWSGNGERIWRPQNNPGRVMTNTFLDANPRGFGLMQRNRNPENYLDGVAYERRPSLWVEPLGAWGEGSVQLVEIPTDDETNDNIVAMWVPRAPVKAGQSLAFNYRLHWQANEPYPQANLATVFATRSGRGGHPGAVRPQGLVKFVVEFEGATLEKFSEKTKPEADITTARGQISNIWIEPIPSTRRWRVQFDLNATGGEPVDLRMYLKTKTDVVSETWLFQFHPGERPKLK